MLFRSYAPTFISVSPVTQVADVVVNSADKNGVTTLSFDEIGNIKSNAPTRIINANPNEIRLAVFILL